MIRSTIFEKPPLAHGCGFGMFGPVEDPVAVRGALPEYINTLE